jgi:hypothetical protein
MGFGIGGQAYPFNYVAEATATGPSAIFPQAEVFDVTAGFPGTSQGKIPLVNVKNGSYGASFVPVAGHNYHVTTDVYTDGTYATLDPARFGTTESVQCGTTGGGGGGGTVIVGTEIDIETQGFEMDMEIEC